MQLPEGFDPDNPQVWLTSLAKVSQRIPDTEVYLIRPEDWPRLKGTIASVLGVDLLSSITVYEVTEAGFTRMGASDERT